jgi:hypothetical protein
MLMRIYWEITDNIKKNIETLIGASKEVGLEVIAEKTKCMSLPRHQNAEQNQNMKIGDRSFENIGRFKYLGTTVKYQNLIQEKIKRRLTSGKACCHSDQKLLSSRLLSKNVKTGIYNTITLPVVLYGCETWSLILREEHSLRVLKSIFGPKRDEVIG